VSSLLFAEAWENLSIRCYRIYHQPEIIDQIMLHKRLQEVTASPNVQIGSFPLFELGDFFRNIPFKNTEGCHSEEVMVFEATYLVAVLTAGQISLCCGQNGAQRSKVFALATSHTACSSAFLWPLKQQGSECGLIHPPYAKPPLVSSSGPPGACMTRSRETNSSTLTFLTTEFLRVLSGFV
jgi:hypothetical protein